MGNVPVSLRGEYELVVAPDKLSGAIAVWNMGNAPVFPWVSAMLLVIEPAVVINEESILPIVAALRDVMRHAGYNDRAVRGMREA